MPRIKKDIYPFKLKLKNPSLCTFIISANTLDGFSVGERVELKMQEGEKWFTEGLTKDELGYGVILGFTDKGAAVIYFPKLKVNRDGWFGPQTGVIHLREFTKFS